MMMACQLPAVGHTAFGVLTVAMVLGVAGCGGEVDYTPSAGDARAALEKALTAWKEGGRPDKIDAAKPFVKAIDSDWQNGRVLKDFVIVGESSGQLAEAKTFEVTLTLDKPAETANVKFYVIGKDPILIFRDTDYQKTSGM